MSFLTDEELLKHLNRIIINKDNDANEDIIDCNAYCLSIGAEASVTKESNNGDNKLINLLPGQELVIPSGQFGLILTEEVVDMPPEYMGFISITSSIKFRGLVNISGFHVDPGYKGRLIFSVYNVSPNSIHLRRGQKIFKLWLSELTGVQKKIYPVDGERLNIRSDYLNYFNGDIYSPQILQKIVKEHIIEHKNQFIIIEKRLDKSENDIQKNLSKVIFGVISGIAIGLLIGLGMDFFNSGIEYDRNNKNEIYEYINKQVEDSMKQNNFKKH